MAPCALDSLSQRVQRECLAPFELEDAKLLSAWHAFAFHANRKGDECIVRITPSTHRNKEQIDAELEWITYLAGRGIATAEPINSIDSRFVEIVQSDDFYLSVVCFRKLRGKPVSASLWNERLFNKWGALVGKLHRLAVNYVPKKQRYEWFNSDFLNVNEYIPESLPEIRDAALMTIEAVKRLPTTAFQYGTIHADVYQDNFFWNRGRLLLFDFDNTEVAHFISDIATALYAAFWRLPEDADKSRFATLFLSAFMEGYRKEHELSRIEIEALPLFLRLREVLIYCVARKMLDLNHLTQIQARLLFERGERIRQFIPIVDLALQLPAV
jgi:Ser/Thr protein kinase RdoA (MazF antagonist)